MSSPPGLTALSGRNRARHPDPGVKGTPEGKRQGLCVQAVGQRVTLEVSRPGDPWSLHAA